MSKVLLRSVCLRPKIRCEGSKGEHRGQVFKVLNLTDAISSLALLVFEEVRTPNCQVVRGQNDRGVELNLDKTNKKRQKYFPATFVFIQKNVKRNKHYRVPKEHQSLVLMHIFLLAENFQIGLKESIFFPKKGPGL